MRAGLKPRSGHKKDGPHQCDGALPAEMVAALNADFYDIRASSEAEIFVGPLLIGRYNPRGGWVAH